MKFKCTFRTNKKLLKIGALVHREREKHTKHALERPSVTATDNKMYEMEVVFDRSYAVIGFVGNNNFIINIIQFINN